jgi:hypothetical protein
MLRKKRTYSPLFSIIRNAPRPIAYSVLVLIAIAFIALVTWQFKRSHTHQFYRPDQYYSLEKHRSEKAYPALVL